MPNFDISAIADTIDQAFQRIRKLEVQIKRLQEMDKFAQAEPEIEQAPCPYIFFPVQVTTLSSANGGFWGKIQKPTDSLSFDPWTEDTSLSHIFVNVVSSNHLPSVDDKVCVFFTGTHTNTFTANYGHFPATASCTITLVTSIRLNGTSLEAYTSVVKVSEITSVQTWTTVFTGTTC